MIYPHGGLTPKQIRTTFFDVPTLAIEFLYGPEGFPSFIAERKSIRDKGSDLLLVGWPDGTTVKYERPVQREAFDVEDLASFYRMFHKARAAFETQGEKL